MPCPWCGLTRWIPLAFRPYCTRSCQADAQAHGVPCLVCGHRHNPVRTPATAVYRSLDKTHQCKDELACRARAAARTSPGDLAAMQTALTAAWDRLEQQGWMI